MLGILLVVSKKSYATAKSGRACSGRWLGHKHLAIIQRIEDRARERRVNQLPGHIRPRQ